MSTKMKILTMMTCFGAVLMAFDVVHEASAQELIEPQKYNAFAAPYELIEGHPSCSGPGQVAFKAGFQAKDIQFRLESLDARLDFLLSSATKIEDGTSGRSKRSEECYLVERKGTEVIRIAVDCSVGTSNLSSQNVAAKQAISRLVVADNFAANFSGSFSACMTMSGYEILQTGWALNVKSGANVVSITGQNATNRMQVKLIHPSARTTDNAFVANEQYIQAIVEFECAPIDWGRDLERGMAASALIVLGLSEKTDSECAQHDSDCFSRIALRPNRYNPAPNWEFLRLGQSNRCPRK